jgi:hypothetical protein
LLFCECLPDKTGELYAGRFVRFNPKIDHRTEYVLPELVAHDRRTWIDNWCGTSTTTRSWSASSR